MIPTDTTHAEILMVPSNKSQKIILSQFSTLSQSIFIRLIQYCPLLSLWAFQENAFLPRGFLHKKYSDTSANG
jgi:hypothetical protein